MFTYIFLKPHGGIQRVWIHIKVTDVIIDFRGRQMVRTREEETEKLKYAGKLWYIGTKEDSFISSVALI